MAKRRVKSWRELARESIDAVLLAYYKEGHNLSKLTTEEKAEIKERINQSYPFNERGYTPYKRWLEERAKTFFKLGILEKLPDRLGRKRRVYAPKTDPGDITPGQLSLW